MMKRIFEFILTIFLSIIGYRFFKQLRKQEPIEEKIISNIKTKTPEDLVKEIEDYANHDKY